MRGEGERGKGGPGGGTGKRDAGGERESVMVVGLGRSGRKLVRSVSIR